MKKAVLIVFLLAAVLHLRGRENKDSNPGLPVTSLIINAKVTVVLVNDPYLLVRMGGDNLFLMNVVLKQRGGTLTIESEKKRNLKNKGVIYIPAANLKYIEINSSASVRTASTLHVPFLDVLINGDCSVHLTSKGKVQLRESKDYKLELRGFQPSPIETITANEITQINN